MTSSPPSAELHLHIEGSFIDDTTRSGFMAEVGAWESTSQPRF